MRIFVTGAAGFIGSNFVRRRLLRSDPDEITVYDALTYAGNLSTLLDLQDNPRFHFIHGDVCDSELLGESIGGHDAVVHFAAESHVDRSISDARDFVMTNCVGTNTLMEAARNAGVDRVVHISTDEVYGSIPEGAASEGDILDPRSPYSASKAGSDLIAMSYFSTHGLPVMVTRSSNNFGPYQHPEKFIPLFITNLLQGKSVPVYGDGLNVRDWCHVDDNCDAIELVLQKGQAGNIYNIGAGNEVSNISVVRRILQLMERDESVIEYVADRRGHDRRYAIESSRMRALGWQPKREFDEALVATVEWYKENAWWWETLKQQRPTLTLFESAE